MFPGGTAKPGGTARPGQPVRDRASSSLQVPKISAALALTDSETTTLRTSWGMWSPVPEMSVGAALQRGSCTSTVRCAWPKGLHLSRTRPQRILIACRLFSRVTGPKLVTVMGAPPMPSCTPVSERQECPDPFAPQPFPFLAYCPENWPLPLLPQPLPVGWGFCLGFLLETEGGRTGVGHLGWGVGRVLGPWPLTRVSNIMVLDFKETSPCSLSPAWDTVPRQWHNPLKVDWLWSPSSSTGSHKGTSPPWATPPFGRDPSVLEARGRHAVKRPMRSANIEARSPS